MLKRLGLENFKGLKKAEIDLGRITILIGPNGTGKSSISQALLILRQSIGQPQLTVDGRLLNLGTFNDILNKDAPQGEIGIFLSCEVTREYPMLGIPKGAAFSYHSYFTPAVSSWDASISTPQRQYLSAKVLAQQPPAVEPAKLDVPQGVPSQGELNFETPGTITKPISVTAGRSKVPEVQAAQKEAAALLSTIEMLLRNTYLVPAIRGLDMPDYQLLEHSKIDIVPGENAQLASTFAYGGRALEETISKWAKAITGSELSASVIPGRKVTVKSYAAPEAIPVVCDGFGTNQLVHLLLTLALTPKESLVAIEEPEIHLHPKAQEKLCDILLQEAKSREKQILVTTHSQYVLWAFVSAVRDNTLTRDDLTMYYFEEKGEEPRRIEQDECGDIYDWGRNFFG